MNDTLLASDAELELEDILIGIPVLRHDTQTFIEKDRAVLDGVDCSCVNDHVLDSRAGSIFFMMIALLTILMAMNQMYNVLVLNILDL